MLKSTSIRRSPFSPAACSFSIATNREIYNAEQRRRTSDRAGAGEVKRKIFHCDPVWRVQRTGKGGADVINDSNVMLRKATDAQLISKQQLVGAIEYVQSLK